MTPRTLARVDTELFADSVEFCPAPGLQHVLACGTYQLEEPSHPPPDGDDDAAGDGTPEMAPPPQPQTRHGRLYLFSVVTSGEDAQTDAHAPVSEDFRVDVPGILDMKWMCEGERTYLGVANSVGELQLWSLVSSPDTSRRCRLDLKTQTTVVPGRLALSLDWDSARSECSSRHVVVSDSGGGVAVWGLSDERLAEVTSWPEAHGYEAWIGAAYYWSPHIFFSGGDDCKLKGWDTRQPTPCFVDSRTHSMGVCSIQSNKHQEHIFAVGSYDESVSIHDLRQPRVALSTLSVGGGVWRVKWSPGGGQHLALADMHAGFHVLQCHDLTQPSIVATYTDESSLAYGVDWSYAVPRDHCSSPATTDAATVAEVSRGQEAGSRAEPGADSTSSSEVQKASLLDGDITESISGCIIASCSFYDHAMHVWQL